MPGGAVTEKQLHVPRPPSVFSRVTVRAPTVALLPTLTFTRSSVGLTITREPAVTVTLPPKDTVIPGRNAVPTTVTVALAPWATLAGLADVAVGRAVTSKQPVHVPLDPSVFVTRTSRNPTVALLEMLTVARSSVLLTKVVEATVMPPPNDTVAPVRNEPVGPVMTRTWVVPWARCDGVTDETVMPALAVTCRHAVQAPVPPSGFVTVAVRVPTVAVFPTFTVARNSVALTRCSAVTVTPPPKETVAPVRMPAPRTVSTAPWLPWLTDPGVTLVTVGRAVTVKQATQDPERSSVFVTVTVREPSAAVDLTVTTARRDDGLSTVTNDTETPELVPNDTFAPAKKPVPAIAISWADAPCARASGVTSVTVGASAAAAEVIGTPTTASNATSALSTPRRNRGPRHSVRRRASAAGLLVPVVNVFLQTEARLEETRCRRHSAEGSER